MKVRDLMALLEQHDPDMDVWVEGEWRLVPTSEVAEEFHVTKEVVVIK